MGYIQISTFSTLRVFYPKPLPSKRRRFFHQTKTLSSRISPAPFFSGCFFSRQKSPVLKRYEDAPLCPDDNQLQGTTVIVAAFLGKETSPVMGFFQIWAKGRVSKFVWNMCFEKICVYERRCSNDQIIKQNS